MAVFEIQTDSIRKIEATSFDAAGLKERTDLQRLLRKQIEVIAPDLYVITEEFGEWDECKRRIDLLAIDKVANLVVIELKRTDDGGHMELQAIRYAAMISTMTFEKVEEIHAGFLARIGSGADARAAILEFLGWSEPDEDRFAPDVRIVLIAADFSKELTTAVMWLNQRGLDIQCIRIKPYGDNGRVLIDVQQVIPLPEAADYQVRIKEKEQKGRQERQSERHVLRRRFWESLLQRASQKTSLHDNVSPNESNYFAAGAGISGASYQYLIHENGSGVELYINRGAAQRDTNKRVFDALFAHKASIESVFGGPLTWDRRDEGVGSSISFYMESGGWRDDVASWPAIQDQMIDAMVRFEKAFQPEISRIRGSF